ncbi:MAG: beta-ketoacyl-ACP synthase II, partial [Gemmataceae bacterium]|nr:beta-ketoacyl-ACP synthase II [Gemmataceae bacterium]
ELYHPGREYAQELHTTPGHVAECFGLEGPNYNCLTSCAAGNQAIGEAAQMIRRGDADVMVAGGTHSIVHPLGVTGFIRLTALSTRNDEPAKASRPFDQKRDGFVMGEGAGILILEDMEHARRRGAAIYAELSGYGVTADAFRVTDNHPEGRNAVLCMKACLADAGLAPEDIGYINAHGTSTQLNDKVETLAIKKTFGDHGYRIPVSSTKSMIGHLIGAAGAVEAVVCVLALRRGVLPPTINLEFPDPDCDLDYVPNQAREVRARHALSNSFGFGGQNVSLIISA